MAGMIAAVQEKGYPATTISDVARAARISRRTLYEHFTDKEACFLAAYQMVADGLISTVVNAARQVPPGTERTHAANRAYLSAVASAPDITRAFVLEIAAVGRAGIEARTQVHQRFASMLMDLVAESFEDPRATLPDGRYPRPFTQELASALAGGINEMVVQAVVTGPDDTLSVRLMRLLDPVNELCERVLMSDTPMA